jgi:hypothetical protein
VLWGTALDSGGAGREIRLVAHRREADLYADIADENVDKTEGCLVELEVREIDMLEMLLVVERW